MTRTLSLSDTSQSPLEKVSAVGLNDNRCSQDIPELNLPVESWTAYNKRL